MFYCDECGEKYYIDGSGVSTHVGTDMVDGGDMDADHVAYGEEPVKETDDVVK